MVLKDENLSQENSFESQDKIYPVSEEIKLKGTVAFYKTAAYSLNIIRIPIK